MCQQPTCENIGPKTGSRCQYPKNDNHPLCSGKGEKWENPSYEPVNIDWNFLEKIIAVYKK